MTPSERVPQTARYFMIGGFLGAGKTTAVAALAQHLVRQGLRVGLITNDQDLRPSMRIDYDAYAEGEALLGWLNATIDIKSGEEFDANQFLRRFADAIRQRLAGAEIAHLKMTFSPCAGLGDIAAVSLVRSDYVPELSLTLDGPAEAGQLIVNLRAEGDPDLLYDAVNGAVNTLDGGMIGRIDHCERFRPGRPTPTHRITASELAAA